MTRSDEEAVVEIYRAENRAMVEGGQASLVGQNRVKASVWGGGVSTWPLQMQVNLKRQAGRWQIVSQVASTY